MHKTNVSRVEGFFLIRLFAAKDFSVVWQIFFHFTFCQIEVLFLVGGASAVLSCLVLAFHLLYDTSLALLYCLVYTFNCTRNGLVVVELTFYIFNDAKNISRYTLICLWLFMPSYHCSFYSIFKCFMCHLVTTIYFYFHFRNIPAAIWAVPPNRTRKLPLIDPGLRLLFPPSSPRTLTVIWETPLRRELPLPGVLSETEPVPTRQ